MEQIYVSLHKHKDFPDAKAMDLAALHDDLKTLILFHERGSNECTTNAMNFAALHGNLDIIRWLHKNRSEGCTDNAINLAAAHGHLDIIKWFHNHNYVLTKDNRMDYAGMTGHLDIIKWLHNHGVRNCTKWMIENTTRNGYLDIIIWLYENYPEQCNGDDIMYVAIEYNHIHIINWLHKQGVRGCTKWTVKHAIINGYLDMVIWLYENYPEHCNDSEMMHIAIEYNQLNIINWIKDIVVYPSKNYHTLIST